MKKIIIATLWVLWFLFLAMPAAACGGCVVAGVEAAVFLGAAFPVMWTMGIIAVGNGAEDEPPPPRGGLTWVMWGLLVALAAVLAAMLFGGR